MLSDITSRVLLSKMSESSPIIIATSILAKQKAQ